jgi:hypothetical protein
VGLVFRPFGDPLLEKPAVAFGKRILGLRRRHPLVGILGKDPPDQLTLVRPAWYDRSFARLGWFQCLVFDIQAQARFARSLVGTMALEAMAREDRPDLVVEIDSSVCATFIGASSSGPC